MCTLTPKRSSLPGSSDITHAACFYGFDPDDSVHSAPSPIFRVEVRLSNGVWCRVLSCPLIADSLDGIPRRGVIQKPCKNARIHGTDWPVETEWWKG